jgi:pimeloyl-ACP methyl ester carboxylesterase
MRYVLLPGAGGSAWYWSRVAPLLEAAGHEAISVELPGADETAGLPEYTALVVDAIGATGGRDTVLVAQSLGGFTAAMAVQRVAVRSLIFVNAMVPIPGETPGAWWAATGAVEAREAAARAGGYGEFDVATYFLHDVPADAVAEAGQHEHPEAEAVFGTPCEFDGWPDMSIRVIAGADDRFFPLPFQQRIARERLGIEAEVASGGHLVALAHPRSLADLLLADR